MKASDYFAALLSSFGAQRAYGLQGGAVAHLFDSLEQGGKIQCVYTHHEQSAALAATADAKMSKALGLVVVTTGPGGTNALTGLLTAWQDSVPVMFVSGQTRLDSTSYGKAVRQVGSQEFPIVDTVKTMTKYAALIRTPGDIKRVFREAREAALTGRPGPVWIDFPLDIQWQQLAAADCPLDVPALPVPAVTATETQQLRDLAVELAQAARPLVLAGHGIHLSNSEVALRELCERHAIPLVSTWAGSDLLATSHALNGGVIGLSGQRGANQLVFQCDLLVVLGANLTQTQVGSAKLPYAPQARKVVITHDRAQLAASTVAIDLHIAADLPASLQILVAALEHHRSPARPAWHAAVAEARRRNRRGAVDLDTRALLPSGLLSSNIAVALISSALQHSHHLVVDGGGTALYAGFQSATRGVGKRLICSSGISAMGTGLAETVGVSLAAHRAPILTIIGDGSMMLNLHDLASIRQHGIPAVIVIINNAGYLAIRHTQRDYFGGRHSGTDERSGLHIPPFAKIVEGFGLPYRSIDNYDDLAAAAQELALRPAPLVLDVHVDPAQDTLFRQAVTFAANGTSSPSDLSEMWPFTAVAPTQQTHPEQRIPLKEHAGLVDEMTARSASATVPEPAGRP